LGSDAEVGDFHFAGVREKDVGGFDVPVDFASLVEIVEAEEQFTADYGYVGFGDGTGFELSMSVYIVQWVWQG
jgi:hypothetical protein